MISAVINIETGLVENIIMADPSIDAAPDGRALIGNPPDFVTIGTAWDGRQFKPDGITAPAAVDGLEML